MSCRQSARKVKLTSKFEEFSTTRLASIQRLAHSSEQKQHNQEAKNARLDAKNESKHSPATTPAPKSGTVTPTTGRGAATAANAIAHANQSLSSTAVSAATPTTTVSTPVTKRESAVARATLAQNNHDTTSHNIGTVTPQPKLTANGKVRGRPRKCWQKAETTVKPMSSTREELLRLREELAQVKKELEERNNEYAELRRQSSYTGETVPKVDYDDLKESYRRDVMHAKRHEWCVMCLNPSKYYCCWNTTYCSQKCQVNDWYARHGRTCERRKERRREAIP